MLYPWLLGPNLPGHHFGLSATLVPAGCVTPAGLYLAPVRPPRLGARLEARDGVLLLLLGHEVKSHLQANGLHVILAQCRGHVHVQLQEAVCVVGGEGGTEGPVAVMGTECSSLILGLGGTPRGLGTHTCSYCAHPGPPCDQCCREGRCPLLELGLFCAQHTLGFIHIHCLL